MNQIYSVFLASATTCAVSFGAITNLAFTGNGTQTTNLVNNQYFGATGRDAAAITNVANVLVSASKFTGGTAATLSTASSITRNGGSGLALSNIDLVTVSNQLVEAETIHGGKGGDLTVTAVATPITVNGGVGLSFTGVGATDSLVIDSALIVGGDGGRISSSTVVTLAYANGGSAILANKIRIDANAGSYTGGAGGNINVSSSSVAEALGGHGLELGSLFTLDALTGSAVFNGGSGGIITNASGNAKSFGGDGIRLFADYAPMDLVLDGGSYQGGNGGTAVFNTADVASKYDVSNLDINGARGGNGVRISRVDQFPDGSTLTIDSGEFIGGDGGVARNAGSGSVNANGGSGVFIDYMDVTVNNGTFVGGKAGSVNGASGVSGAGAHFQDSNVEINNGDFQGDVGLRIISRYYMSETTINDGTFTKVEFSALDDGAYPGFAGLNNIRIFDGSFGDIKFDGNTVNNANISGGTVGNIDLAGSGKNNLTLTGGTNGTISLAGTATAVNTVVSSGAKVGGLVFDGLGKNIVAMSGSGLTNLSFAGSAVNNTLNITNNNAAIANVEQFSGVANVSFNTGHAINNMYISNGTMNISGSDLEVASGNTYRMGALTSRLNTTKKLTVESGGTLDVRLGQVSATTFVADSGSQLRTELGNTTNGLITGTSLTFNSGVKWSLYGSSTNTEFKLASASVALSNNLTASDFDYTANDWWVGVSSITNRSKNLYATLGDKPWDVALGAEAGSEYEQAMQDLSRSATNGTAAYNLLTGMSQAQAQYATQEGYMRTPEMANTLIRLQEVFAGQIKDRTGSFRRYENWGSRASSAPSGAQGPETWYADSMEWLEDHLPSWDGRGAVKDVDAAAPRPNLAGDPSTVGKPYVSSSKNGSNEYKTFMDWLNGLLPDAPTDKVELPPTYQVWGRGYGSFFEQKSDAQFAGYEASIGGAIAGIDKRFDSLLLGLAGGYAHTKMNGNSGNDGEADTGHGTLYAAFNGDRGYVDANVNYAYNAVTTEGNSTFGYTGKYDASAVSVYLGGGLGYSAFHDTVLFTPEASLLSTYYNRDGYTETSSLTGADDKQWDSYDQWSYLGSLGATLSMIRTFESFNLEMEFQPELRAHWLHEFNAEMDAPTYMMVGGGNVIGASLQAREEDLVQIGTGVRFSKWGSDTLEFGLDVDGVFGQDYSAYIFSGKMLHRF